MKKMIETGISVLVFLLPWQTRWIFDAGKINGEANEFLSSSLYLTDILLIVLLFLAWLNFQKKNLASVNELVRENKLVLAVALLFLISTLLAENKSLALYFETRLLLAVGFFGLLIKFGNKLKLAVAFIASLILPSILALWQFFGQQTFASKWLGLADHPASQGGSSVVEIYAKGLVFERWLRAYGSFDHPNILGGVLAVGILVTLWILIQKWQHRIWVSLSLILFSAGIFASLSRTAWVALFLGIVGGVLILFLQKRFTELKIWGTGVIVVGVVFLGMFFNYQNLFEVRLRGGTRLENISVNQRNLFFQQAKDMILENAITGVGSGNYVTTVLRSNPGQPSWLYQPVHNVFLLIWAELGLVGIAASILLLGKIFFKYVRKDYFSTALFFSIMPILMLDHWFWSLHFGMLFFALIFTLMTGFIKKEKV